MPRLAFALWIRLRDSHRVGSIEWRFEAERHVASLPEEDVADDLDRFPPIEAAWQPVVELVGLAADPVGGLATDRQHFDRRSGLEDLLERVGVDLAEELREQTALAVRQRHPSERWIAVEERPLRLPERGIRRYEQRESGAGLCLGQGDGPAAGEGRRRSGRRTRRERGGATGRLRRPRGRR